jgi:phosphatidate cytidylyltransferase
VRALSDMVLKSADPRWSDLRTRTASALVLGPLALFCVWRGGLAWDVLVLAAMVGLGWEWGKLAKIARPYLLGIMLGLVWACQMAAGPVAALVAVALLWVGASFWLGRFAGYGVPYAGICGITLIWLRQLPSGLEDTAFLVLVVWATDIGAYLAGRLLGGPKLAPRISPGKTWAGSIGGLLAAAVAGAVLAVCLQGSPLAAFAAGGLLSLCAQAGDLLESAIKRKLGVKDSGRTIPGHGGLFDRLDGFLAAAPVAALLALCVQGGVPLWQ